ncbi:phosphotransferase enzyme family protein [Nannizzia gypsea CBS 118893]|uniref:Phosphotransferase enzyme family protein n=1 Tax=Arthroderma gypseum (strain ATCC MYA-4604 / CBS 118893) TaxID=535722 RepID=E4V1M7_ARTGP|nr:phosphotransferase enzyme family protein [Nannizzia gypsea CBS 118893]EFR03942.1 phosphotransferase enzyme family protein [Nannizzia gypsea CBS 118893]
MWWRSGHGIALLKMAPPDCPRGIRSFSLLSSQPQPQLFLEKPDGTEVPATEQDMFAYRRHRWLSNEDRELALRYLPFDIQNLIKVAVHAVGDHARCCTKILKCAEGLHNKAFLLTLDTREEVLAKLPNPNAGPSHYLTASEVATREFLREVASIPIPRALSWSSNPENPVGAEYIIEEKAAGTRLGSLWHQWPRESKLRVVEQIISFEHVLTTVKFSKHGSIYFKEDLPQAACRGNSPLLIDPPPTLVDPDRYIVGLLARAELWSNGREKMDFDRGPWQKAEDYARAIGENEMAWIKAHASPRMDAYVFSRELESPNQALNLLSKYLGAVPYLIPNDQASSANVLWHPDLYLDNIFVDPETCEITGIVDWQGTSVAPLFYQSCVPKTFRHEGPVREGWVIPSRPDNFDSLTQEEQIQVDRGLESETIHKYYEAIVCKRSPHHWEVLKEMRDIQLKRNPTWLVTGVWDNRDLFFLRQSLIAIEALWDRLRPDETVEAPFSFTREELDLHMKEDENITGVGQMLKLFRDQGILPVDGMVDPEDYGTARANCRKFKDIFIGAAKDGQERELFSELWPYQDRE